MELEFDVAKMEECDKILEFLWANFYFEEPVSIGIEPKEPAAADEQFTIDNVKYGTTILARHNRKIVGVLISGPITPDYISELKDISKNTLNYKWSQITNLLAKVQSNANIFMRYNITQTLHIHALAVDIQYRGKSIGKQLIEQLIILATRLKYPLVSVDCTGYYSTKLAVAIDMDLVASFKYSDYRDENGLEVFEVRPPHSEIKTFVKKLVNSEQSK